MSPTAKMGLRSNGCIFYCVILQNLIAEIAPQLLFCNNCRSLKGTKAKKKFDIYIVTMAEFSTLTKGTARDTEGVQKVKWGHVTLVCKGSQSVILFQATRHICKVKNTETNEKSRKKAKINEHKLTKDTNYSS